MDTNDHDNMNQDDIPTINSSEVVDNCSKPYTDRIGHYKIIRVIGEGGMGIVYEAEQDSPKRRVALKIIRSGLASSRHLRRFEFESDVLGQLDHPGIATIYEAGTFDSGSGPQPYFAMEYVQGKPLTAYANNMKLNTQDRLKLVARVAEAVQHAHQKGVIHRDIKPANILVTETGDVKVLDFGVARATDSDTNSATFETDIGQLIGTIPYMSPEQASGDPDELDTRSDVYALGILAYELLSGRLPYDVHRKMIHEAVRVIREDTPIPLSSISRVYRGDIEIIISKALSKEKGRRYQSANDLSEDITRYLNNEAIVARPPSALYQLSKFSKRNKSVVYGILAVLLVSTIGTVVSVQFGLREAEQKRIAILNEIEASKQRDIAQGLNRVFRELIGVSEVDHEDEFRYGEDLKVGDALELVSEQLETTLQSLPNDVIASVHSTIGEFLLLSGRPVKAERHFDRALEMVDMDDPALIDHIERVQLQLAIARFRQGKGMESLQIGAEAIRRYKDRLDESSPELLDALHDFASVLKWSEQVDEAIELYEQVIEARGKLNDERRDRDLVDMKYNLALAMEQVNNGERKEDAKILMRTVVDQRTQIHGEDHENTINAKAELGRMIWTNDVPTAEGLLREALSGMRELRSDKHWRNRQTAVNIALLISTEERYEESIPMLTEALESYREWSEPAANHTLTVTEFLVRELVSFEDLDEAKSQIERAIELIRNDGSISDENRTKAIDRVLQISNKYL